MIRSKTRITKALISLRGCAGWSASLLFANPRRQVFSRRGSILLTRPMCWPHLQISNKCSPMQPNKNYWTGRAGFSGMTEDGQNIFIDLTPNRIRELYSAIEPSQEKVANVVLKTFEEEDLTPIQMAMINHFYCRISISCSKLRKEKSFSSTPLRSYKSHSFKLTAG